MKRIYITASRKPGDGELDLKPVNPVGFYLDSPVKETYYPIVPVIAATAAQDDEVKVIVVRQLNEDSGEHDFNFSHLKEELDELGVKYTLTDITYKETQQNAVLLDVYSQILDALDREACYYADITFGTKTWPVLIFALMTYIDRILPDTEVMGIYYMDVKRKRGVILGADFYDVSALFTLTSLVDTVADMRQPDDDMAEAIKALIRKRGE